MTTLAPTSYINNIGSGLSQLKSYLSAPISHIKEYILPSNQNPVHCPSNQRTTPIDHSSNRLKRLSEKIDSFENEQRTKRLKETNDSEAQCVKPLPKTFRRKVYIPRKPTELFCKASEEIKENNELSIKDIREHAASRVRIFAKTAACYYQCAFRSGANKMREVEFFIGHADFQVGKGSNRFHASHDDAGAGLGDNLRDLQICEIIEESDITPLKKRILQAKGCTEQEFNEMEASGYSEGVVNTIFNRIWPNYESTHPSLFNGSLGKLERNRTTELPARVNLICDKRLETYMRPLLVKLYTLLAFGEVTPEEATEYYTEAIKSHLRGSQKEIEARLAALDKYWDNLDEFLNEEFKTTSSVKKIAAILILMRHQTATPTNHGVARAWLPENDRFIAKLNTSDFDSDSIERLNKFISKHTKLVKKEIENQRQKFQQVLIFNQEEEKGTQFPEFSPLFGTHEERKGKRPILAIDDYECKRQMLAPHFLNIRA